MLKERVSFKLPNTKSVQILYYEEHIKLSISTFNLYIFNTYVSMLNAVRELSEHSTFNIMKSIKKYLNTNTRKL